MRIFTPTLVDRKTGLPLNTGGDPRFMKLININEYYYFEIISGVIDQIEKEYKLRYSGAQRRTMEVVRMVVHHLLTSEYPLRISKTALCSKNTMRNIADRLSEVYPRMFQCLRGFPSDRGNVPSVITWRYKTRERFLTHTTWNYKKHRVVFDLIEYDPYVFEDKLLEESYLKNKLRR